MQVNRGGGILHAFLAKNCIKKTNKATNTKPIGTIMNTNTNSSLRGQTVQTGQTGHHVLEPEDSEVDYEFQDAKYLTKTQLLHIILHDQEIGEAQWLSAISTGLLYEDYYHVV